MRDFKPALARLGHFGLMLFETLRNGDERPNKHAGVPTIVAAVHLLERSIEVWFFDEPFRAEKSRLVALRALGRRERFADVDITITGIGFGGLDADRDNHLAAAGEIERI